MMRYLPGRVRVAIAPATVALAAGCGAEISSKPAPVSNSAEVIAPHMGLTKALGYVASPLPPTRTAWSTAMARTRFGSASPDRPGPRCCGCPDTPAQAAPVQAEVREALSREEVSAG